MNSKEMGKLPIVLLALCVTLLLPSPIFAQQICPNSSPRSMAVGDFDGDGKLDIALVQQGSGNVFIHTGNGSGGLAGPTQIASGIPRPTSVVAGNFGGGAGLDLAVAGFTPTLIQFFPNASLSILRDNGAGGFLAPIVFNLGSSTTLFNTAPTVTAGDFNNDNLQDLAVVDARNRVVIFLQQGGGGFAQSSAPSVLNGPIDVAVGKFDANTTLDLVVANRFQGDNKVTVLFGNGAGGTSGRSDIATGGIGPQAVVTGKFNNDTHLDLAVLHFGSTNVSVLLGDGAGGFSPAEGSPISLPVIDANGASLVALDFNGDGKLDLAASVYSSITGENNIFVLLANGQGGFPTRLDLQVEAGFPPFPPSSIVAADFNGDGLPDLAASFFCSGEVQILINPSPPPGKGRVYVTVKKEDKVAVIDPETDTVVENIAVDKKPDGITILPNGTKVYVVNERKHPPGKGEIVTVIKTALPPNTHSILKKIDVGKMPRGIAATPVAVNPGDGNGARFFVYVAEKGGNSVGVIDSSTDTLISRVPLDKKGGSGDDDDDDNGPQPPGRKPIDIAFSPDGRFAYVLAIGGGKDDDNGDDDDDDNGSGKGGSAIVVLDTSKAVTDPMNAVLNRVRIQRSPEVIAADPLGQFVYVGRHGPGEVLILNASGAPTLTEVGVLAVGRKPRGITIRSDGNRLYVSNHESNDVTVISRSGSTHTILDLSVPVERKPLGIAILPEGTKVYVANEHSANVSVIEANGNNVTGPSIPVGKQPRRIAAGRVPTSP